MQETSYLTTFFLRLPTTLVSLLLKVKALSQCITAVKERIMHVDAAMVDVDLKMDANVLIV